LFACLLVAGGCYKYVPVPSPATDLERGTAVRAHFENGESVTLGDLTAHNIISMDAEFVRQDDSELVLSAFWLDSSTRGIGYPGEGWTVRVPTGNISLLEQKKLDVWRTAGLVAAAVVTSVLGWEALGGGEGGEGGVPPDGGPIR
jgi:hypothetical protein